MATLSAALLLLFVLAAITAPIVSPYSPTAQNTQELLQGPSPKHLLGTDLLGRDVLSRVIYGARVSFAVAFVSIGSALLLGTFLGLVSGYHKGWFDELIMRFNDALLAFPTLLLAIAISGALGPGVENVMIAIAAGRTPAFVRLVRGEVLLIRELQYIEAARSIGGRALTVMLRHVLPNTVGPVFVQTSLALGQAILYEAGLSFLGLGVQPPNPSWGEMLNSGRGYMESAPWVVLGPGAAIFITVLSFSFVSDGLHRVLDPTFRGSTLGSDEAQKDHRAERRRAPRRHRLRDAVRAIVRIH